MDNWSNLSKVVYLRTYARKDTNGIRESWPNTVERVIRGNINNCDPKYIERDEAGQLEYLLTNRKAGPAGRGWWFSGASAQDRIGGAALTNCWFFTADVWENFVLAADLLMLGGGVGFSVEHRFVSKLPKVKRDVKILHKCTKDADFIVPDSREGWTELLARVLDSFFVSGKSFSWSSILVRGAGEPIHGFGGISSGPKPLVDCIDGLSRSINARENKHIRPIDAVDIICTIADMVVSGNVRRSALLLLGDPWDKEYLKAKRFDLSQPIPSSRARANFSVVCEDIEDLHPLFWRTYEHGEPFGIVNRRSIQQFGRSGKTLRDSAIGVNPCAEATLENGEPCNLQEIWLSRIKEQEEFNLAARLMHRWGKRVTLEKYHHDVSDEVIKRNRRVGTGTTGCLQSSLFNPTSLEEAYQKIQSENESYSKLLGIPKSIRTTVIKPSGTLSLLGDCTPGIHAAYSKWFIRRVRFAGNDPLLPLLRKAGHKVEPEINFDGSLNHNTQVVDFYDTVPDGTPCVDDGWGLQEQLDTVLLAQKYWADQSVSCTIYYKKSEIPFIKEWLSNHLKEIKAISFLPYQEHEFLQAPLEAITSEQYDKMASKITPIDDVEDTSDTELLSTLECEGAVCPVK